MIQISLNNTFGTFLATNITTTNYAPGYIYIMVDYQTI